MKWKPETALEHFTVMQASLMYGCMSVGAGAAVAGTAQNLWTILIGLGVGVFGVALCVVAAVASRRFKQALHDERWTPKEEGGLSG